MTIYDAGGRLYEWFYLAWTLGRAEAFKHRAVARLPLGPGSSVLDWGCGTGLCTRLLLPPLRGRGSVYGVDVRPGLVRRAAARLRGAPGLSLHFLVRDGFGLHLPEPVDVTVASYALGVLEPGQVEEALAEIWRNTRPGGTVLVLDMYVPETHGAPRRFWRAASRALAGRIFRQDFSGAVERLLPRFFEPAEVEFNPRLQSFAYRGKRCTSANGATTAAPPPSARGG